MLGIIGGIRPYSNGFEPGSRENQSDIYIPFVAYIRLVPQHRTTAPSIGRRFEVVRNLEKMAWRIEERLLEDHSGSALNPPFMIQTPLAVTPQIGGYPAHITVVGFNNKDQLDDARFNVPPTTNIDKIHTSADPGHSTAIISGNENTLADGEDTTATVNSEVTALRLAIYNRLVAAPTNPVQFEAALITSINDIYAIEYNGIKFGVKKQGGRSFPS